MRCSSVRGSDSATARTSATVTMTRLSGWAPTVLRPATVRWPGAVPPCADLLRLRQADRAAGVDHLVERDRGLGLRALTVRSRPDGQDAQVIGAVAADPGELPGPVRDQEGAV